MWPVTPCGSRNRSAPITSRRGGAASRRGSCRRRRRRTRDNAPAPARRRGPASSGLPTSSASSRASRSACAATATPIRAGMRCARRPSGVPSLRRGRAPHRGVDIIDAPPRAMRVSSPSEGFSSASVSPPAALAPGAANEQLRGVKVQCLVHRLLTASARRAQTSRPCGSTALTIQLRRHLHRPVDDLAASAGDPPPPRRRWHRR